MLTKAAQNQRLRKAGPVVEGTRNIGEPPTKQPIKFLPMNELLLSQILEELKGLRADLKSRR